MADDRRREVEVGAGLQESRLNEEFIDALKKHGPKVIYALAAVVLVTYGVTFYQKHKANQKDEAFAQLDAVSNEPDALLNVAQETEGQGAVPLMARLNAASAMMDSARARIRPGVTPTTAKPEDQLSDAQVQEQYQKAAVELQAVITATKGTDKHLILQRARWDLASAKASLGETDAAKQIINDYVAYAEAHDLKSQADIGRKRLATFDQTAKPKMVRQSQLLMSPVVTPPGATPAVATTDDGPKTPRGNKLDVEGQKLLERILRGEEDLPKDWKRTDTDILIPVRDDGGQIIAWYSKTSLERGAVDPRWVRVLAETLRGNVERSDELEQEILHQEGMLTKKSETEKPETPPAEEQPAPTPAPTPGG
ncbi:MAG: hypothetical protein KDA20_00965 [Phycisphaerales bacterium]|nr:hypothetical protein [Phycisphaerales bacterium]